MKERRREVRLAARDDDILSEASALTGVPVSEFLLSRALTDAAAIVADHRTIRLDAACYQRFVDALDRPMPAPAELLEEASKARPLKVSD